MVRKERKGKGKPAIEPILPGPPTPPKMTAQQRRLNEMLKSLMEVCASLSIKVAACGCTKKDKCGVYLKSREIAKIIDKMQDLRIKAKVEPQVTP